MTLSWFQRLELVLFTTAFLCKAVAAAALTQTQDSFSGSCPLYGVAAQNGSSLALSSPSASSLCYFVAGVSGLPALYCLLFLLFWIYSSCIEDSHTGPGGLRIALTTLVIALFLILVTACILRLGTSSLCSSIVNLKIATSRPKAQKISYYIAIYIIIYVSSASPKYLNGKPGSLLFSTRTGITTSLKLLKLSCSLLLELKGSCVV
ncbi:PREDICTED: transmembrane protein 179B-like [Elephantulus edwardii]|uniref:transmembrane protein 179B-like n=1 Tax=Elephantulus edwardii TaxID=28737 RepID=UPI0003F061A6|nr:PREDICTED: transmembrane protein 179B-like [Elephantulus edwardii]